MKKRLKAIKCGFNSLKKGLLIEWKETKEIPSLLIKREFKIALIQIGDIIKMSFLALLWIIPGGSILSALILKYIKGLRPTSFK